MFARYAFIYLMCVLLFAGAVRHDNTWPFNDCVIHCVCVCVQVAFHHVWLVSLPLAVLWGVFSSLVTLTPGHDSR